MPRTSASHSDAGFARIDATLKQHHYQSHALIEVLHAAQQSFGYLSRDVLFYIARELKLPPSRVYGTATFYHLFTFEPRAEHSCVVCLGTACFVRGGSALLEAAERSAGIHAGETTTDGRVSLTTARCLGTCGIAPLAVFDGDVSGHLKVETLSERLKGWSERGPE
jgi:bidirectional [NiFe] hydrogenase diaphorase subunit